MWTRHYPRVLYMCRPYVCSSDIHACDYHMTCHTHPPVGRGAQPNTSRAELECYRVAVLPVLVLLPSSPGDNAYKHSHTHVAQLSWRQCIQTLTHARIAQLSWRQCIQTLTHACIAQLSWRQCIQTLTHTLYSPALLETMHTNTHTRSPVREE